MKINWKVRVNNPLWWVQIALAIITPILAYAGISASDVTTWAALGNLLLGAVSNPYVLATVAVSVWNACNDPTVGGLSDSKQALTYVKPKTE
jgi:phi LC3 family holin